MAGRSLVGAYKWSVNAACKFNTREMIKPTNLIFPKFDPNGSNVECSHVFLFKINLMGLFLKR